MTDRFYDYSTFNDKRLKKIMYAWDGLGGYHGLLIKKIGSLIPEGITILDVGCGLCHLYEVVKYGIIDYIGVDKDIRVVEWAKKRYPELKILHRDVYEIHNLGKFDVVTAVGLYSGEPESSVGVENMLSCAKDKLVITYFHKEKGNPVFLNGIKGCSSFYEVFHDIDERLTILEVYK